VTPGADGEMSKRDPQVEAARINARAVIVAALITGLTTLLTVLLVIVADNL